MYGIQLNDINLAAVFGVFLGIYLLTNIDEVARSCVTFVKGWRSQ